MRKFSFLIYFCYLEKKYKEKGKKLNNNDDDNKNKKKKKGTKPSY